MLAEWGTALIDDPDFHKLVDDVSDDMHADPSLAPMLSRAADLLLRRA